MLDDLEQHERKVYSQNGEDGVLAAIFAAVGVTNRFFVEFGCQNATECNSAYLLEQGWHGLLMDNGSVSSNPRAVIQLEHVTAENINALLNKYKVPLEFDLLSIDIDGNDYWVWKAITYRPRVLLIEYNAHVPPDQRKAIIYEPNFEWIGSDYFGASLRALKELGEQKGYTLVYCEKTGANAFFIRSDVLPTTFAPRSLAEIYRPPNYFNNGQRWHADIERVMVDPMECRIEPQRDDPSSHRVAEEPGIVARVAATFAAAVRHHQTGDMVQAERLYRDVIRVSPNHSDSHQLLGVLAFQCGRFDVATESFRRSVSLKPDAPGYHSNLGLALAASGRVDEAIACFESALQLNPGLADAHSNLGNALLRQHKPIQAKGHYQKALQLKPDNAEAHCGLGVISAGEGKFNEAESHYRVALQLVPNYAEAHHNLAHALHNQGRHLDAIAHSKRALQLRPEFPEAQVSLGNTYLQQQKWRDAETCFREALRLDANFVEAQNGLGHTLERQNRLREARNCFEQALHLRPDFADAYNGLGNTLARQDDSEQALNCYRKALSLKPNFPSACNNLGCLLARLDKLPKAVAAFQRALRLQPDYADAHCNLGDALRRQGKLDDAVDACRLALRFKPDFVAAHFNLGLIQEALSNAAEAVACFEGALRLDPDSAETHARLGHVYMELAKFDDAAAHYERAVFLKPDYGEAHVNLALVRLEQGQLAKAEMHFQHALRWWPTPRVRIKAATYLPPLYQSLDDMQKWRQRVTDQVQLLHDEGVTLDVTKDSARTVFYLPYQGLNDRELQHQIARLYVAPAEFSQRPKRDRAYDHGKIKVGMISHCFRQHSVGYWMRGIVAHLSRQDFDVTVLSVGNFDDDIARFFKQHADHFAVVPRGIPESRRLIADQQFDVLIYTDIGMDPNTYTLALSRLAPVQCATVGHPVTSGLDTIDYYISSEDLETPGSDEHYTETLIRLRTLPVHMYPTKAPPRIKKREDFGLAARDHVYACLQSLFKFHPEFDALLGGILRGDPRGILLLSRGQIAGWEQLLRQRFAETLPDVLDRIRFVPLLDYLSYLDLLTLSDVQLDTIHFGGGSTSYEALSVGLPIVTQPTRFLRGRFTWALYKQMDILDCVANNTQDYVKIALRLGTDKPYRDELQSRILAANHVLFENSAGVRELEQFLKQAVGTCERE